MFWRNQVFVGRGRGEIMKKYLVLLLALVSFGVTASAGAGVDEVAKWTGLAAQTFKGDPRSSQVIKAMIVLTSAGAAITFVLPGKTTVSLVCHNMGGQDMCM